MNRVELINELTRRVIIKESTHVKAKQGMGSTTMLRLLEHKGLGYYAEPRPLKPLLKSITKTKGTINELKKKVKPTNTTLLLDDAHLITKQIKEYLNKLLKHGLTMISAGRQNPFRLPELKLMPLSKEESFNLVNHYLTNKTLSKIIVDELGGNPTLLMNAVRKARVRDLMTSKGLNDYQRTINNSLSRHDLLKPGLLTVISAVLLSSKYLFYRNNDYETGYLMAMIAYSLITITRLSKFTKGRF